MKQFNIFLASLALSLFALFPAAAMADDDELDVTMEVLDSIADIDGQVIVMQGPEDGGLDGPGDQGDGDEHDGDELPDRDGESAGERDHESDRRYDHESDRDPLDGFGGAGPDDGFVHDADFGSDGDEEHSEHESDFDEGDNIDIDVHDEEPMHDEMGRQEGDAASGDVIK